MYIFHAELTPCPTSEFVIVLFSARNVCQLETSKIKLQLYVCVKCQDTTFVPNMLMNDVCTPKALSDQKSLSTKHIELCVHIEYV